MGKAKPAREDRRRAFGVEGQILSSPLMALFLLGGEDLRDVCPLTPCHDIVLFGQPSGGRASWLCFSSGEQGLVIGGGEQCAYKVEVGILLRRSKSECGGGGGMGMTGGGCEEKIFVLVRLRPLNEKETARNDLCDWECINEDTIIFKNYRVFRSDCSTKEVYEKEAKDVALSVVSGINSTVFAYGQTSSGKTFSMTGITEYAVADIYYYIIEKHNEREFLLKFSAMEIHNESVRDLLSTDSTPLRLLDDPEGQLLRNRGTSQGLESCNGTPLHLRRLKDKLGQTALNETSSRSHQIIRLTIESSARQFLGKDNLSTLTAAVEWINFVDLGGSERTSQSLSAGTRLKAGCHINRSLLTLGTVIRKLSKGRNGHVPFRDSKLTRILQSSLGDNARTSIICTMEVATNAQVNVVILDKALVKHLQRELARLESELRSQGHTFVASHYSALLREKGLQIEKLEKEMIDLTVQRDLAKSQVQDLLQLVGDEEHSMTRVLITTHTSKFGSHLNVKIQYQIHPLWQVLTPWTLVLDQSTDIFILMDIVGEALMITTYKFFLNLKRTNDTSPQLLAVEVRCIEAEESNRSSSPEQNTEISESMVARNGDPTDHRSGVRVTATKGRYGRLEDIRRRLYELNYGADIERLSRKGSQSSIRSVVAIDLEAHRGRTSPDDNITKKQVADNPRSKSLSNWPSEFKTLQKEIIELSDVCNVSLVHRTYFFLLFKGDPTDSIYVEVELRRLSFFKDMFSRGSKRVILSCLLREEIDTWRCEWICVRCK
ncbi:unnamed protein product [Camellia sinensis]